MLKVKTEKEVITKKLVCKYLEECNYIIIEKDFKYRKRKIDIIAYDTISKELVFIDLRSYYSVDELMEESLIGKEADFKYVAKHYNREYGLYDIPIRFDIIKIYLSNSIYKLRHFKEIY